MRSVKLLRKISLTFGKCKSFFPQKKCLTMEPQKLFNAKKIHFHEPQNFLPQTLSSFKVHCMIKLPSGQLNGNLTLILIYAHIALNQISSFLHQFYPGDLAGCSKGEVNVVENIQIRLQKMKESLAMASFYCLLRKI